MKLHSFAVLLLLQSAAANSTPPKIRQRQLAPDHDELDNNETLQLFQDAFGENYRSYYEEFLAQELEEAATGEDIAVHRRMDGGSRRRKNCPGIGEGPITLNFGINIIMKNYPSNLCMVFKVANDGSYIVPLARSYNNGNFEFTAGGLPQYFASIGASLVLSNRPDRCVLRIPQERGGVDYKFALYSYDHTLDDDATMARFLEQASFGTRRQDLEIMRDTFNYNIEAWMEWQINQVPLTSHREWYRKRTNPRLSIPILAGNSGPHPCDQNARWRRFAFSVKDTGHYLTVTSYNNDSQYPYLLMVDGVPRTFSTQFTFVDNAADIVTDNLFGVPMEICQSQAYYEESIGRIFAVSITGGPCIQIENGNPAIDLSIDESVFTAVGELLDIGTDAVTLMDPIDDTVYVGRLSFTQFKSGDEYILNSDLDEPTCDMLGNLEWGPFVKAIIPSDHGTTPIYLIYEGHLEYVENTAENPIPDGGGATAKLTDNNVQCANVARTFLNEEYCTLSTEETACGATSPPEFQITLDTATIIGFYETSNRYVYAIENLPLEDTSGTHTNYLYKPCQRGFNRASRWLQVDRSECDGPYRTVQETTENAIIELIELYDEPEDITINPLLRDINLNSWLPCDALDEDLYNLGLVLDTANDICWKHVHPLHWNVYDFTNWVDTHPGGADKITQWAQGSLATLIFPTSHHANGNERFYTNIVNNPSDYPLLGRFGDTIAYYDLPVELHNLEFELEFGETRSNPTGEGVLVCGSIGEVANDPTFGSGFDVNNFVLFADGQRSSDDTTDYGELERQRTTVWSHIALFSDDQLRQRVAWALSQILVVDPNVLSEGLSTEGNLKYYDIFVRNAFGTYRDILKQVAFDFNMGEMLSSIGNKSLQYSKDNLNIDAYPDENFAREIMQLFSIGLFELNADGTPVYVDGKKKQVYSIEDILTGARAWTGFEWPERRGNTENRFIRLDPMNIRTEWRDVIPKSNLYGGYIGDHYPLCIDQPDQQFLKKGATYRLLGSNPKPDWLDEHSSWDDNPLITRLELDENEELATLLCAAETPGGDCTFPTKVVLEESLVCGTATCDVGSVRTIKVASSPFPVYYEYVRPPCVEQAFYENAVRINDYTYWNYRTFHNMCGDPRRDIASEGCCDPGWEAVLTVPTPITPGYNAILNDYGLASRHCHFNGERMTFAQAQQRCIDNGKEQCQYGRIQEQQAGTCLRKPYEGENFHWTNAACSVLVKVAPNGKIAIVHDPTPDFTGAQNVPGLLSVENRNYFVTPWDSDMYPKVETGCDSVGACTIFDDDTCLCHTTVTEGAVFDAMPTRVAILDYLFIGAVHPDVSDLDYTMLNCGEIGVDVYVTTGGSCSVLDESTIFRIVDDNGVEKWLKNMYSTVNVANGEFSFRNPVHFISFAEAEKRDILYEIDAVLDQYIYHPNHPPFLATRMIQRFGISNPSPSFVLAVATAYRVGEYQSNGLTFGNRKYGDMAALVAAILLHPESRTVAFDADPTYGSLREPLLKVIGYMRNMDYVHYAPLAVPFMAGLGSKIGQGAHEADSVFSFFLPDFSPAGVIGSAGLVSPEAQVLTSAKTVNLMEGLFGLTKYGMNYCKGEGSLTGYFPGAQCQFNLIAGDYSSSVGYLNYSPSPSIVTASDLVDELALLMTSSRLRDDAKVKIIEAIEMEFATDLTKAVMIAQQLILSSPEFHSTSLVRQADVSRPEPVQEEQGNEPYKAIVYFFLNGGLDSYNVLVPKSDCVDKDLFAEYQNVRGSVALDAADLIDITTSGTYRLGDQPCATFGVNDAIPYLAELYSDGDALFFANTGVLHKPVTKDDWNIGTDTPLFSHNSQTEEAQKVDIEDAQGETGVIGRIFDVLKLNGYQVSAASVDEASLTVTGSPIYANPITELGTGTPAELCSNPTSDAILQLIPDLNNATSLDSSIFGETFSNTLIQSISENTMMVDIANMPEFDLSTSFPRTTVGRRFESAAQWIKARDFRKVTRDGIFIEQIGYDFHATNEHHYLELNLQEANDALEAFVTELKDQGIWDDVVIVTSSDFGRTLTPNSGEGTDHAWGGNYALMGGGVNGGRILGKYPDDLTEDGPQNIGRGRLIPTTPWDGVWLGVSQYLGVTSDADLDIVLPNRHAFDDCQMYPDGAIFESFSNSYVCTP